MEITEYMLLRGPSLTNGILLLLSFSVINRIKDKELIQLKTCLFLYGIHFFILSISVNSNYENTFRYITLSLTAISTIFLIIKFYKKTK